MKLDVLLFCSRDSAESFEGAHTLHAALSLAEGPSLSSVIVDKLSSDFDDLALFARHRIVRTPAIIVLRGEEEVARILDLPSVEELLATLRTLV